VSISERANGETNIFVLIQTYISLALPMASLLASMLAFGRLGVDSEVTGTILAALADGIQCILLLPLLFLIAPTTPLILFGVIYG